MDTASHLQPYPPSNLDTYTAGHESYPSANSNFGAVIPQPHEAQLNTANANHSENGNGHLAHSYNRPLAFSSEIQVRKHHADAALSNYLASQHRGQSACDEDGYDERKSRLDRVQTADELKSLRACLALIIRGAQKDRWRRIFTKTIIAILIPAMRAIWRRPRYGSKTTNQTEYAFEKSRSLLARIKDYVPGWYAIASLSFFVFAVASIFHNHVRLRVARKMSKQLLRLEAKVDDGAELNATDLKTMQGWRWRVLLSK